MVYRRTPFVEARQAARRHALMDAAERVLAEQGASAPVAAIARAARSSIGTLYRHFPTLADLRLAVADRLCDEWTAATQVVAAGRTEGLPRLVAGLGVWLGELDRRGPLVRALVADAAARRRIEGRLAADLGRFLRRHPQLDRHQAPQRTGMAVAGLLIALAEAELSLADGRFGLAERRLALSMALGVLTEDPRLAAWALREGTAAP